MSTRARVNGQVAVQPARSIKPAVPFTASNNVPVATNDVDIEDVEIPKPWYRRSSTYLYILVGLFTLLLVLLLIAMTLRRDATRLLVPIDTTVGTGTSTIKRSALFCLVTHKNPAWILANTGQGTCKPVELPMSSTYVPTVWQQFYINDAKQVVSQADGKVLTLNATTKQVELSTMTSPAHSSQCWTQYDAENGLVYLQLGDSRMSWSTTSVKPSTSLASATPINIVLVSAFTSYMSARVAQSPGGTSTGTSTVGTGSGTATGTSSGTGASTGTCRMVAMIVRVPNGTSSIPLVLSNVQGVAQWLPDTGTYDAYTQLFCFNGSTVTNKAGSHLLTCPDPLYPTEGALVTFTEAKTPSAQQEWSLDAESSVLKAIGAGMNSQGMPMMLSLSYSGSSVYATMTSSLSLTLPIALVYA